MDINLFYDFTAADKEKLTEVLRNKLQERWKTKCEQAENLQVGIEKFKTNNEQRCFELERDLVQVQQRFETESKAKSEFEVKSRDALVKVADLEKEVQQLDTKNATLLCQLQITKSESDSVCQTSTALSSKLETKNRLILDLKAQIAGLEAQVSSAMRVKAEAQIQSEEAASLQNQLKHKEKRLSQEHSLLRGQVELLQEQLEKRVQEALQQRNDNTTRVLHLQQDLFTATSSSRSMKENQDQLQRTVDEKTKRVEELLETLKDSRENELKLEESFMIELSAQKKLVTIYKSSSEDLDVQNKELERGVGALRTLLEEASQQYGALERGKEQQAKDADHEVEQREELIHDLREELSKVNMLLEASAKKEEHNALFTLTPAAAAASQLMSKGLTLSQLYAEHLTATEKLLKVEEENSRLTRYIDQILQEIEERAPALQKQREEYLLATETVAALQQQMEANTAATQSTREESGELDRRCRYLVREQERLNVHNADLGRQVTVLLTQVEASRAGLPPPQIPREDTGPITTGGDVVSAHLVCFRDVSELQQQNQKLLLSIRELSEQAEEAEKTALDKRVHGIQGELTEAHAELEQLRSGRDRIEALVENISRQRDMYRSLLAQQQQGDKQSSRNVPSMDDDSRPPSATDSDVIPVDETRAASQQLRDDNVKVTKDLDVAKKSLAALQEDHKQLQRRLTDQQKEAHKQAEDLRNTLEKTRTQNVKLLSHAEYNEERLKTLQGNCESYQRQVNGIEEKNTTLQSIVSRHEATMDHLRGEHMGLVKKLAHAEVIANNLKEEKMIFKETEARLLAEREAQSRQESSQAMLLSSLESIKNNLEHKDTSDRIRMQNQIMDLNDQNTRLKAKLESNTDYKEIKIKLSAAEDRLKVSERDRFSDTENLTAAREQLTVLQKRYEEALNREKQLVLELRDAALGAPPVSDTATTSSSSASSTPASTTTSATTAAASTAGSVRDLEVQLGEERGRVSALERALEMSKASMTLLQATCTQQEKELKHSTEVTCTTIKKMDEVSSLKSSVDKKMTEMEEQMRLEQERSKSKIEQLTQQLEQTRDDVVSSKDVVETAKSESEMAKKIELEARKSIEQTHKEMLVVQQKYEREVMLHGTDLQALAKLKGEVASHTSNMEKLSAEKIKAEETLKEVRRAGNSLEESLKADGNALKERITEMEEQNEGLVEQFTQLSDNMAAIQLKLGQDGNESLGNNSITEDETRSSDQLREVVKYLRRERELATGRCDVAQAEAGRHKAHCESVTKHAQQLTKELAKERENKQVCMDTATRYGELLRKVHTVDALADSNCLLRREKDALHERAEAAKTQAQALQTQVGPLNTRLAEALAEGETVQVEKKALEKDVEMYKKRTQELVEKLNRAKPEDFMRMQQELSSIKNTLQGKELDCTRLRMQVSQLQKNIQTMVTSRLSLNQQLTTIKEEKTKVADEAKKLGMERSRLVAQVGQQKELVTAMQGAQQQEQLKQLEQRNQLLAQVGDIKQREEAARRETDLFKKEIDTMRRTAETSKHRLQDVESQKTDLQKQMSQLRKIATKYKKAAETAAEEEGNSAAAMVKEFEAKIATLTQQLEEASNSENREQEDVSRTKLMEAELTRVRQELDARNKEVLALRGAVNKRLEEATAKKAMYESRITQLDKEKEQLSGQLETLSLKLNVQQRQIMMDSATRQKQTPPGTSKPSTSGGSSSDKSSNEPPPTANIKPLAAATPSVTMSSPRPTLIPTPPSRTIPTASIRPLAPPPSPGIGVVPPRDVHSEGLVSSSTVTLPQATVTPTPATPSATLPTTATTTTTQPTTAMHTTAAMSAGAATLTATVSPTPVSTSLPLNQTGASTAAVSANRTTGINAVASTPQAAALQLSGASQQASVAGTSMSSAVSIVVSVAPQDQTQQQQQHQQQQQVEALEQSASGGQDSDDLVSQAIAMMVVPSQDQPQQQQQSVAGPSTQKRKRDEDDQEDDDESKRSRVEQEPSSDSVSQGGSSSEQSSAPQPDTGGATSSQQGEARHHVAMDQSGQEDEEDVILVDSDDEEGDLQQQKQQQQQQIVGVEVEESEAEERQQPGVVADDEKKDQLEKVEQQQEVVEAPSESHQPMHPQVVANSSSNNNNNNNNNMQQQPSSSSAATRQAALVLPRPSAASNNDRVGSSGSSEVAPHPPLYDESSDDSIVPSTPTLFATRRGEGFPEPVSSPQRGGAPAPRSPSGDVISETGVSTSDAASHSAAADSGAAEDGAGPSLPQHQEELSSQEEPSTGDYPEADSMVAEVEEVEEVEEEEEVEEHGEVDEEEEDVEEEEEEDESPVDHTNEEDDEVVEIGDDEDDQSSEAQQQQRPGEAAQNKFLDCDVSSGGEEGIAGGDPSGGGVGQSSSSYAASSSSSVTAPASPSSSSARRITPITWGAGGMSSGGSGEQQQQHARAIRGRGPYRSSDRIMGRRQQQQQEHESPPEQGARRGAFSPQRSPSRGGGKARRSRQHM